MPKECAPTPSGLRLSLLSYFGIISAHIRCNWFFKQGSMENVLSPLASYSQFKLTTND